MSNLTVQYLNRSAHQATAGYYVIDEDYENIFAGPFETMGQAELWIEDNTEPPEPREQDTFDADEAAEIKYRADMKDAGRGHLLP